jgi:hypothetical protein
MKLVWLFFDTEERDILLAEGKIDLGQRIESRQLAGVDLKQADMGHGFGQALGSASPCSSLLLASWLHLCSYLSCSSLPVGLCTGHAFPFSLRNKHDNQHLDMLSIR